LLTLLSLAYMVFIIAHFDLSTLKFKNPFISVGYIVLFGVWSSLFSCAVAYNGKLILDFVSESKIPLKSAFQVYLESSIAKYLPGNVMHYVGRNYLGNKLGWSNPEMAFSSVLEFVFSVGNIGLIIVLLLASGLITIPPHVSLKVDVNRILFYLAVGATSGLIVGLFFYAYSFSFKKNLIRSITPKLRDRTKRFFTRDFVVLSCKQFLISLSCFLLGSLFYYSMCDLVLGFYIKPADILGVNAALYIANYASIIAPGVPGGIGLKESVSFLLIRAYGYPIEELMISILILRVVCVLGDLLPFLFVIQFRGYLSRSNPKA